MLHIHGRLFFYLVAGFIAATVLGTLSHECGHYIAARYYGREHVHISYAFTMYGSLPNQQKDKQKPVAEENNMSRQIAVITAAGPVETILTGNAGLLFLLVYRRGYNAAKNLAVKQWLFIFLSLFWLRPVFNVAIAAIKTIAGHPTFNSDEFKLDKYFSLPAWSLNIITGVSGLIALIVIITFIPVQQKATFLAAGITGSMIGALLWLVWLGPILMP